MKIKLLIATADNDYAEHLSNILSEKYMDTFEVNVCSSVERLRDLLAVSKFDAALLESDFATAVNTNSIRLPLILMNECISVIDNSSFINVRKYQRISSIAGNILENYAEIGKKVGSFNSSKARITAVWSPSGGTGKTTVSLAFAANKILNGKHVVYLNLENFSSTSVYFQEIGKSISKVFEKLETNVHMFLMGIRQQDSGSGISYFCGPENYDDINILTIEDIEMLVDACAIGVDELVIDLSSQCDERIKKIFDFSDTVLLICDSSNASQAKLRQFVNQHNVFGQIQAKTVLVNNKSAKIIEPKISRSMQLPYVQSGDPISIYKTLSSGNFDW